MLPADAPPSFVLLTLQCLAFESPDRPIGLEVQDWVQDLYQSVPPDTVDVPIMNEVPEGFGGTEVPAKTRTSSSPDRTSGARLLSKDSTSQRTLFNNFSSDFIRRTGLLSKRNATGFRNWKKVLFTLHKTKLSYVILFMLYNL